jgi:hypothetical protein
MLSNVSPRRGATPSCIGRSARTVLAPLLSALAAPSPKLLQKRLFLVMERAGLEPATSGLQTHPITRLHQTPIDRIGMVEPKSAFSSNVGRHR